MINSYSVHFTSWDFFFMGEREGVGAKLIMVDDKVEGDFEWSITWKKVLLDGWKWLNNSIV